MAKAARHAVDMANGGLFKKLVKDLFHYTDKQVDDMLRRGIDPDFIPPGRPRNAHLGPNPTINSPAGDAAWARFAADHPGDVFDDGVTPMIRGSDGNFHPLSEVDMAHTPHDAVSYWNNHGRFLGRGPDGDVSNEISTWMGSSENYTPQWRTDNRSAGGALSGSGIRYQPPVDLARAGFTPDQISRLLSEMRVAYTTIRIG